MIDALLRAYALKDERRTGWVLRGITLPESVADHSWGTAFLALVYADDGGVDRSRSLEIAVVHDLAEALTGDTATRVASLADPAVARTKQEREAAAMEELLADYPTRIAERLRDAWFEYEARSTPEALFVRDMNLIDMCIQALAYERERRYDAHAPNPDFPDYEGLDEFFATTRPRLSTALGRRLFDDTLDRYAGIPHVAARGGPSVGGPADG